MSDNTAVSVDKSEIRTFSEDRNVSGVTRRVVFTETTTKRKSLSSFQYEEDEWEQQPKTDYTYSKTASYIKYSPTKGYRSPNMARRSLRGMDSYEQSGFVNESWNSSVKSTRDSRTESIGEFSMEVHGAGSGASLESGASGSHHGSEQQVFVTEGSRRRTIGGTTAASMSKQRKGEVAGGSKQLQFEGEYQSWRANDPSLTRSGTQYSLSQRLAMLQQNSSQNVESTRKESITRNLNFDDVDESDYTQYEHQKRQTEKRLEYAGEAIPYKEAQSPVPHLYGPDNDSDGSDLEYDNYYVEHATYRTNTANHTVRAVKTTSITTTITRYITTVSRAVYNTTKSSLKSVLTLLMYIIAFIVHVLSSTVHTVTKTITSLSSQSSNTLMEWIRKSCSTMVYVSYCVGRVFISSLRSGYHSLTTATSYVFTTLTSPITYLISMVSSVWRKTDANADLAKSNSNTTESISILTSSTKKTSRKSTTKSVHFEDTVQSTSEEGLSSESGESNNQFLTHNYDEGERLQLADSMTRYLLFIPSIIYAYLLYPVYSLLSTLFKSIYQFTSWIFTPIRSSVVSLYSSVSSLWRTSEDVFTSKSSPSSSSAERRSNRLRRLRKQSGSYSEHSSQGVVDSGSDQTHKIFGLLDVLLFVPSKIYGYVIYPVVCSLWWIWEYIYESIYSGISKVSSLWKSDVNNTHYDRKSSSSTLLSSTTSNTDNRHATVHSSSKGTAKVYHLVEESDGEDIDAHVTSESGYSRTSVSTTSWIDSMLAVLLFVPKQVYGLLSWLLRVPYYLYEGCKSFCQWLFVDVIANSAKSLWSKITTRSSASRYTYESSSDYIVGTSKQSNIGNSYQTTGMEGSESYVKSASGTTSVKRTRSSSSRTSNAHGLFTADQDETDMGSSKKSGIYLSSTDRRRSRSGSWGDCMCSALMFIPMLLYALVCAIGRLFKYIYHGLNSFFRWLFVDTVGYWTQSGFIAAKTTSESLLAYIIYSDVWISSRSRKCGLCCLLPLIFLLPLLLCGGYYVYDQGSDAVVGGVPFGSIFAGTTLKETSETVASSDSSSSVWWWPWLLFGGLFGGSLNNNDTKTETMYIFGGGAGSSDESGNQGGAGFVGGHSKSDSSSKMGGATVGGVYLTDADLQAKIKEVFIAMYGEREAQSKAKNEQTTHQILIQQQQIFNDYKTDIETLTKKIVKEELQAFATGWGDQRKDDLAGYDKVAQDQLQQGTKIKGIQDQVTSILAKSDQISAQILAAKDKMKVQDESDHSDTIIMIGQLEGQLASLTFDIAKLQASQAALVANMRECCKNDSSLAILVRAGVRDQLSTFMGGAMNGGDTEGTSQPGDSSQSGSAFMMWLQNQFAKRDDIDEKIAALAAKLNEQIKSESESAAAAAIAASVAAGAAGETKTVERNETKATLLTVGNVTGLSEEQVKLLIREALYIFGADKTGMVDYALESAGGSVISTRCSETYHRRTAQLSLFGIPLWYNNNSPRTVIQPEVHPGQCWPFSGDHGYIVIQLAGEIRPTAFSLEHIPKTLSPTGQIDSAPRVFSVKGLEHEKDSEGYSLGSYTYDQDGEPLQYFPVNDPDARAFSIVELMIESNWGNKEYTCLYRFRVHGHLQKWMGD